MSTILVVDDEPTVLSMCQRMLQTVGYEVLQADGGEAALRIASDPQHSIDLALLDIMMPGLNGIELAARLHAAHPQLPIVLMSGYSVLEINRIVGEHPYRIIWKPFKTESLLRMIENALGQSSEPLPDSSGIDT
jgi:two-component system, cell cycle sensor histidine kinase and response regulator CckA